MASRQRRPSNNHAQSLCKPQNAARGMHLWWMEGWRSTCSSGEFDLPDNSTFLTQARMDVKKRWKVLKYFKLLNLKKICKTDPYRRCSCMPLPIMLKRKVSSMLWTSTIALVLQKLDDTSGNSQREPLHQVKDGASPHQSWPLGPQRCEKRCLVVCFSPGYAILKMQTWFSTFFNVKTCFHVENHVYF